MISEFALDPELVSGWYDPKEWAFFREAFADETGRLGSTFPRQNAKKWRQLVLRTFRQHKPDATAELYAWQRLEARLEQLSDHMVERRTNPEEVSSWLDSALAEHRVRPFHGILSTAPAGNVKEVITPEMLFRDHPPDAWTVPPCSAVLRTPSDFARTLQPLLSRCREAVFIDPWFNPREPRFTDPLRAMLDVLWRPDLCAEPPTAQLVIAESKREQNPTGAWQMQLCREQLPRYLPRGRSLTVTVLRERQGSEKIHNRYVLTKFAGVGFGTGLDVADEANTKQTDDLCRLSREQLLKRWGQYVSARKSYFDIATGPETISSRN